MHSYITRRRRGCIPRCVFKMAAFKICLLSFERHRRNYDIVYSTGGDIGMGSLRVVHQERGDHVHCHHPARHLRVHRFRNHVLPSYHLAQVRTVDAKH